MKKLNFGSKKHLTLLIVTSSLLAALTGMMMVLLGGIVDYGQQGNLEAILPVLPWFGLMITAELVTRLLHLNVRTGYIKQSMILLKEAYLDRLLEKDITELQKEFTPVYRSQLTQDMDRYENKFFEQIAMLLQMGMGAMVSLVILFTVSPWVGLGSAGLMVVFVLASMRSGKPLQKGETKKTKSLNDYTAYIEENLEGFEVIKQHQLEGLRKEGFMRHAKRVQDDNYALDVKTTTVDSLNTLMQMMVFFVAICGGLWFANQAAASVGDVIKVIMAFSQIMWPMQQMVPTITQMISVQDVLRTFDERLENKGVNRPLSVSTYETFSFKDTDLGYDSPILKDVNFDIGQSDKILIVGPSGAGKSTVLKTMRQSIVPLKGQVMMNDQPIQAIDAMQYYRNFATVDQVGYIFNGTLQENLTLHQTIDQEKVKQSLAAVGLQSLDPNLVLINNGANLSGGQRARLLAARALCLDASIIVCDEIFAALDASIAKAIEHDLLKLDQAIVNVSHIFFEENLNQYDAIYRVDEGCLKRVFDTQTLIERMLKPA